MKKFVYLTTAFVLFLIFILPAILLVPVKMTPFNNQPGYSRDERRSIYNGHTISQEFTAQTDNLMAIALSIGNPNLKNKKAVNLKLYDEGGNLLRTSVLNGLNIEDGDYIKFIFPVIPDSKGKLYEFVIDSPDAGPEEVLYVFPTVSVPSWVGRMAYRDEKYNGGLSFVTYSQVTSKLGLIKEVYGDWIGRVFGR